MSDSNWSIDREDYYDVAAELLVACGCVDDAVLDGFVGELARCAEPRYDPSIPSQVARVHLDNIGLIEHGCSIRGSWPTPKGVMVLDVLSGLKRRVRDGVERVR